MSSVRVFLCHSSSDKPVVRNLYHRLRSEGVKPWFDEEDLLPGQDWQSEISKAVRTSDAVILCLSQSAVTKAGYFHKEIQFALDVAAEQPEGAIFLVPTRLEECAVPDLLKKWHWVDLFEEKGFERLMRSLSARQATLILGDPPGSSSEIDAQAVIRPVTAEASHDIVTSKVVRIVADQLRVTEDEVAFEVEPLLPSPAALDPNPSRRPLLGGIAILGGILLGAGISNLVAMALQASFTLLATALTIAASIAGAFLVAIEIGSIFSLKE